MKMIKKLAFCYQREVRWGEVEARASFLVWFDLFLPGSWTPRLLFPAAQPGMRDAKAMNKQDGCWWWYLFIEQLLHFMYFVSRGSQFPVPSPRRAALCNCQINQRKPPCLCFESDKEAVDVRVLRIRYLRGESCYPTSWGCKNALLSPWILLPGARMFMWGLKNAHHLWSGQMETPPRVWLSSHILKVTFMLCIL